jgi:hypothetical protein
VSKGVGAQMLKVGSKRRRTKAQIMAEKEEEEKQNAEQVIKLASVNQLEDRINQLENQVQNGKAASSLMSQFINAGLVQQTSDDSFIIHGSHGDRDFKAFDQQ